MVLEVELDEVDELDDVDDVVVTDPSSTTKVADGPVAAPGTEVADRRDPVGAVGGVRRDDELGLSP